MENRPFDFYFGFAGKQLPGINGLTGNECNFFTASDPSKGKECVQEGRANYVCEHGSRMSFNIYDSDIFGVGVWNGTGPPYPNVSEFGTGYLEMNRGNTEVMWQMSPQQIPVKMALAQEFAVFDDWHAAFPGPSTPNHLFLQTATSAGCTETGSTYKCKPGGLFPQKTIYESLTEQNHTWAYFYNDSCWNSFMHFFHTPEGQAGLRGYDEFYHRAAQGTLPSFSWVLPRQGHNKTTGQGSNDDHPCHDIALGERLLKDTYEAVRASPKWNETVMIVTYDDPGGWYDHAGVPVNVPAPDNETSCPDDTDFTWMGARVPTLLISPWVEKGRVIHKPDGPFPDSVYEHSSIPASLKDIFGLPNFLTKRDAWAGSFLSELTLSSPRKDTIEHTPEAPPPAAPGRGLHCSAKTKTCSDLDYPNKKQRQRMRQWAMVHDIAVPDFDEYSQAQADDWIQEQFLSFRAKMLATN